MTTEKKRKALRRLICFVLGARNFDGPKAQRETKAGLLFRFKQPFLIVKHVFSHFFSSTYFQKIQTLLIQYYYTGLKWAYKRIFISFMGLINGCI